MNPFAQLDDHFARQFGGLPQIEPPIAPGLAVTEYRMDGILTGNADMAINNRESVEGICVEDEDE